MAGASTIRVNARRRATAAFKYRQCLGRLLDATLADSHVPRSVCERRVSRRNGGRLHRPEGRHGVRSADVAVFQTMDVGTVDHKMRIGNHGMRIVVLGMMGRCPFGGQTWLYLNWLLGLSRLGHDVWYVEDDSVWPYDPIQNTVTCDCTYAVKHVSTCMEQVGLADKWAFRLADRHGNCWGLS